MRPAFAALMPFCSEDVMVVAYSFSTQSTYDQPEIREEIVSILEILLLY